MVLAESSVGYGVSKFACCFFGLRIARGSTLAQVEFSDVRVWRQVPIGLLQCDFVMSRSCHHLCEIPRGGHFAFCIVLPSEAGRSAKVQRE